MNPYDVIPSPTITEFEPFLKKSVLEDTPEEEPVDLRHSERKSRCAYVTTVLLSSILSIVLTLGVLRTFASCNGQQAYSMLPALEVSDCGYFYTTECKHLIVIVGPLTKTWEFDPVFVQPPSNETDEAWASLIPSAFPRLTEL